MRKKTLLFLFICYLITVWLVVTGLLIYFYIVGKGDMLPFIIVMLILGMLLGRSSYEVTKYR